MSLSFSGLHTGRLEICARGTWKRICGLNFGHNETSVACRELGYSPTRKYEINVLREV